MVLNHHLKPITLLLDSVFGIETNPEYILNGRNISKETSPTNAEPKSSAAKIQKNDRRLYSQVSKSNSTMWCNSQLKDLDVSEPSTIVAIFSPETSSVFNIKNKSSQSRDHHISSETVMAGFL